MSFWKEEISLDLINKWTQKTLVSHLNIEFIEIGSNFLIAKMPVDNTTKQPMGSLHGGASCVLIETIATAASNFCIDRNSQYSVGLEINVNHIKPMFDGFVFAKTTPIHLGRSTHLWDVEVFNEDKKIIAVGKLTTFVKNKKNI